MLLSLLRILWNTLRALFCVRTSQKGLFQTLDWRYEVSLVYFSDVIKCGIFHKEQRLIHRAAVHWEAYDDIVCDYERGIA